MVSPAPIVARHAEVFRDLFENRANSGPFRTT